MRYLFVLALVALPMLAAAQAGTISPGMPRAKVVAALGEPVTARVASDYTYLFYRNECGRSCGMNDLVVLRGDSVVDAIFRSPSRHYTGTSSSPAPISHTAARTRTRTPKSARKMEAPKVAPPTVVSPTVVPPAPTAVPAPAPRMKPMAPNDTRPSIPAGEPPLRKPAAPTPVKPATP